MILLGKPKILAYGQETGGAWAGLMDWWIGEEEGAATDAQIKRKVFSHATVAARRSRNQIEDEDEDEDEDEKSSRK